MTTARSVKLLVLMVTILGMVVDTTAFGAVRRGARNNRNSRTSRTSRSSRPNALAGVMANVQKASAVLNTARAEKASATSNLARVRSNVNARHDNSTEVAQARAEFNKAEAAHESVKAAVLGQLKQNNPEYQAALVKLKETEEQLKKLQSTGAESQLPSLKADARQQRLEVSAIETAALQKDPTNQPAQSQRDAASQRIQSLHRASEAAIAKDSELSGAKSKAAQATAKMNTAQTTYSRAVASANAASQVARAQAATQATRPRYVGSSRYGYGQGRHYSSSRSHSSRSHSSRFHRYR